MTYIDVILPLPLAATFTYSVPSQGVAPRLGMRVLVPFGQKKTYTAIIKLIHSIPPEKTEKIKEIIDFLDDKPIITRIQMHLWEWIASYYMCSIGEVYKAAIPSAFKIENETKVILNNEFEAEEPLPENQQKLLRLIGDGKTYNVEQLAKQMELKNIGSIVNKLVAKGAIVLNEVLDNAYRTKTERVVILHPSYQTPESLQPIFNHLNRAQKQLKLFMHYLELSGFLQKKEVLPISQKTLLERANANATLLKALTDKNILCVKKQTVSRLVTTQLPLQKAAQLNEQQTNAVLNIQKQWREKSVVLLHGVTSSGKTEIYIELIKRCLSEQKQVLYLVPEIALTTQLTTRLQAVFGQALGVYHSKFSDAERVEIYQNLLNQERYNIIIGVRSSLFLPFRQIGLIIVDEEHEPSYKQHDPAPRYHARNAAIVLAQMHNAKTLLGSATPSIESYHNAQSGKYGLVEIHERFNNIAMPEITVIDTRTAYHKKMMTAHFADELIEKMKSALEANEQVILFQNRRGYASFLQCKACGHVPKCIHCDVSLTIHKAQHKLLCHYCGYTQTLTNICTSCGSNQLSDRGFGTQKIEDEIQAIFPDKRILRMDLDTTRNKKGYQHIIDDFGAHKADILVGTQMVTKGLHFDNVSLVAVLSADSLLSQADFRASERSFQMLEQVAGRAGRKHKQGSVYIQTASPNHSVIQQVVHHNYVALYQEQIAERKLFRYPPFYRLLQITIRHRNCERAECGAALLEARLQQIFGNRSSAVVTPVISRVQNLHIRTILLRIEQEANIIKAKELLQQQILVIQQEPQCKGVLIHIDVDPM